MSPDDVVIFSTIIIYVVKSLFNHNTRLNSSLYFCTSLVALVLTVVVISLTAQVIKLELFD